MTPFNATTSTRWGTMTYHRFDAYVGASLEHYGEFSPGEVALLTDLVGPGSVVVDGGANIGALTLPLARTVGIGGRVYAIEPQRLSFQALCGNVAQNSLMNVVTLHAALGRAPGTVRVPVLNLLQPVNVGGLELGRHTMGDAVPVLRIDDLPDLALVTLIKLDLEGGERAALAGARRTIRDHQPILYVEADREGERAGLIADLRASRYRCFWHTPPLYVRQNWRGTPENRFGEIVSLNILALPAHDTRTVDLPPVEDG